MVASLWSGTSSTCPLHVAAVMGGTTPVEVAEGELPEAQGARGDVLPIMPDAILAPLGARHPSSWWNLALAALSGTALGGAASYPLGASGRPARPILARVPMVREPMVTAVDDWLATEGSSAVRRQALSGIPFKVFALRAGARRIPLGPFLAWALLGRGARFFTVSGAAALLGRWFGEPLRKHGPTLLLGVVAGLCARLPPDEVTAYTELFTTVLDGRSAYLRHGVKRALGREPRDFTDYARDTAASGVWGGYGAFQKSASASVSP